MWKMIYVFLADGFEESEAIVPIDIMKRAGLDVVTVCLDKKLVTGSHKITVEADIPISSVQPELAELIMLPGGPGYEILENDARIGKILDYAAQNDIYIAAICAAPSIIGKRGLTKGKKAVCFPGYEKYLDGADIVPDKAVQDGKIITGKGAGAAMEFGFTIVEALKGKNEREALERVMQF